jgi:hypothetical protein
VKWLPISIITKNVCFQLCPFDDSSGVPYLKVGFELEPFGTLDFGGIDKFVSGLELYVDNVLNNLTS